MAAIASPRPRVKLFLRRPVEAVQKPALPRKPVPLLDLGNVLASDCHVECQHNVAGSIIHRPQSSDPRELSESELQSLCPFHINGLRGWAVVTNVEDGDTLDIVKYVPLVELAQGHNYKYYSKRGVRSFIHTSHLDSGFFAKFRCRLLGIDAMEHNYPEGNYAKQLTIDLYRKLKGHIWVEFVSGDNVEKTDKYGRTLIRSYTDESKQEELTHYLLKFNDADAGIIVAENYDGGTKSDYAKGLKDRSEEETERMTDLLNKRLADFLQK
jgi:hypothetical protein